MYLHIYACKTTKKQQFTDSSSLYKISCEPVRFTRLMVLRVLKLDSLIDIFMTGISFSLLILSEVGSSGANIRDVSKTCRHCSHYLTSVKQSSLFDWMCVYTRTCVCRDTQNHIHIFSVAIYTYAHIHE